MVEPSSHNKKIKKRHSENKIQSILVMLFMRLLCCDTVRRCGDSATVLPVATASDAVIWCRRSMRHP